MDKTISKLLPDGILPPEVMASLQEAFDAKVAEVREQAEMSVREEFALRYEHDKTNLVEAMDRMLSDVVEKHEAEKNEAVTKFNEARTAFRKAVKESRKEFKSKLDENYAASRSFITEKLSSEIAKLREQRAVLKNERLATAEKLAKMQETFATEHAVHLAKIDSFVVKQVQKELSEFAIDQRALVETRLKLVYEADRKLDEAKTQFVKEAARKVNQVINESLTREMTELREDIERNRQNTFGRRIFEAVAGEYMTSYLAEGTEVRNLQNVLESTEAELAAAKAKLDNVLRESQQASKKAKLAEEKAIRSKEMGELLSNLRGEKRMVMEGMLESVKTDALRSTFNKLLPMVLDETTRKTNTGKTTLNEKSRPTERTANTVVTGDNRNATRLFENSSRADNNEIDNDIAQIIHLAGINR